MKNSEQQKSLSDYKDEIKIYKLIDQYKESDSRAIETVKKHLTNPSLFKKLVTSKVNIEDIDNIKTEHSFRGIWAIKLGRKVEFQFKDKKDLLISEYNLNKVNKVVINNEYFRVEQNKASITVIEEGYDEYIQEYLFEFPRVDIDKSLEKYLKDKNVDSKSVDKRVKKWLSPDTTIESITNDLHIKEVFEWLDDRFYAQIYDDRNNKNYSILNDILDVDISLYLIPTITVECKIKGELRHFDIDAITREIMKPLPSFYTNDEFLEEKGSDMAGEVAALFVPYKILEEPTKKVTSKAVKAAFSLFKSK